MTLMKEEDARNLWTNDGFENVFDFEEYINLLERTHIHVIRDKQGETNESH